MRSFCLGSRPSLACSERSADEPPPALPSLVCACSRWSARARPNSVDDRSSRRLSNEKRNGQWRVSWAHHEGKEREQSASGSWSWRSSLALSFLLRKAEGGSAGARLVSVPERGGAPPATPAAGGSSRKSTAGSAVGSTDESTRHRWRSLSAWRSVSSWITSPAAPTSESGERRAHERRVSSGSAS